MFSNYLKIAFRTLSKHKGYSFINVFGLAVGIASFILIFLYVHNETTYDTFHEKADRIYRIYTIDRSPDGGRAHQATTPHPLAQTLTNDYPELVNVVGIMRGERTVTVNGKSFEEMVYFTDPGIFKMLSFPLVTGNPETALEHINSVVIVKDLARKYFGNENPIGEILTIDYTYDLMITGVLEKLPGNTIFQFGMVIPAEFWYKTVSPEEKYKWYSLGVYTFVQCSDEFPPSMLEDQLPLIKEKYVPDWLKGRMDFGIQPLTSIHLDPDIVRDITPPNSTAYLYVMLSIAFSVLLIACINFMNLSTARYTERTREIGVRKVLGARSVQLVIQFLSESIILSFLALLLGIALAELFLPQFNTLSGRNLALTYHNNPMTFLGLLGFGLFVGMFSGSYPAFFLSTYRPAEVLKGRQRRTGGGNVAFRRILVIIQFAVSIGLIICTLMITRQIRYMRNHELGFNPDDVLALDMRRTGIEDPVQTTRVFLNAINPHKERLGILSIALSENIPGCHFENEFEVIPENWDRQNALVMVVTSMDENFLDTYQMQLVEGRNFSLEFSTDKSDNVLLSETAVRRIGWKGAIGKHFHSVYSAGPLQVIGVVKDIHFKSLQTTIEPLVYRYAARDFQRRYLSIRIQPEHAAEALTFLEQQWRHIVPDIPFDYFFIHDRFAESYQTEERTGEIIGTFSLLAILLACLGLLGLAALTVTQRTKEIGIRKVLGASVPGIVLLLSKDFTKWVLIANLVAWPVAYFAMKDWLQSFAYRIDVGVGIFVLGGVLVLIIALLTVSLQTIKAALANPVDALRYE